jgi:cytochrome c heme-lyase
LVRFQGDATKLSPRARMNTWMGYKPPFDRHDWTIDRCGKQIDYIIDFYGGQGNGSQATVNFYMDVRPKLTLEGGKMRLHSWMNNWLSTGKKSSSPEQKNEIVK